MAGEPVQEAGGRGDVAADVEILQAGGVLLAQASPQPAQVVPDRVAVEDLALGEVVSGLDCLGDPTFQHDEPFVARRQGPGGDQDAT